MSGKNAGPGGERQFSACAGRGDGIYIFATMPRRFAPGKRVRYTGHSASGGVWLRRGAEQAGMDRAGPGGSSSTETISAFKKSYENSRVSGKRHLAKYGVAVPHGEVADSLDKRWKWQSDYSAAARGRCGEARFAVGGRSEVGGRSRGGIDEAQLYAGKSWACGGGRGTERGRGAAL